MAYRLEKELNGEYALVIDGWEKGIAPDPYSGMNRMLNVNLNTPGEVAVGYPITESTLSGGGSSLGRPIADSTRWFSYTSPGVASGSPQSWAVLDANGRVWESSSITGTWTFLSSGNSTTNSSADDGIAYWMGYLFKTRGTNIDYWNGTTWTTGWSTALTASTKHFMYVGTDNVLYITNGNYVATIALTDPGTLTSFNPASAGTYVITAQKLQLSATDTAISLAEIGSGGSPNSTLLIGGVQNYIYPWDKTSVSFALPIVVGDPYINRIVSVNQNAFIFAGNRQGRGRIYITNGSQADEWLKIPDYLFNVQEPYFEWGDAIFHRNQLLFGVTPLANASGQAALTGWSNVWAVDLDTRKLRAVSQIPASTGISFPGAFMSTGSLATPGLGYIVAWYDGTSASSIGYSGTTAGVGTSTIDTDLIPVGTFTQKRTYSQVEFKLRTPLASGESISITPYIDGVATTALSFQPTVTTGSISGYAPINWTGAQWLQFGISLTGNSATSGVRLKEIRLR